MVCPNQLIEVVSPRMKEAVVKSSNKQAQLYVALFFAIMVIIIVISSLFGVFYPGVIDMHLVIFRVTEVRR